MENKKMPSFLAIILMIMWGVSYLSIKVVVEEINPILSAFYRFFIAAIILYIILKVKYPEEKVLKEDRIKMALGGFLGVSLYFLFENYSVLYTSASNVSILMSTIPVFTLISQRFIFKERMTLPKIAGASLSFLGIVIIIASKDRISLFSTGTMGDLMALMAAICWIIYNVVNSKFKGNYKSITITAYQAIWGTIFLAPSLFIEPLKLPSLKVSLNILFLAVFCSTICYVIYIYCLENLGAVTITTYINLQAIISLISARLILKENVALPQVLGCIIIITGVYFVSFGERFNLEKFEEMV